MEEKEKKEIKEVAEEVERIDRKALNLQNFFDDMQMIGDQTRSGDTKKPNFHYGDLAVTNYLIWLMLAELKILNEKLGEE